MSELSNKSLSIPGSIQHIVHLYIYIYLKLTKKKKSYILQWNVSYPIACFAVLCSIWHFYFLGKKKNHFCFPLVCKQESISYALQCQVHDSQSKFKNVVSLLCFKFKLITCPFQRVVTLTQISWCFHNET